MAVLIKDAEADRLIRELASRTGETFTEAVRVAVDQRLRALPARRGRVDRERLAEARRYFDKLPRINEHLTDEEIIGYNDEGHFD